MGKILSLLVGAIVMTLGIILLVAWWYEFVFFLKGIVPVLLIFGGVIAMLAGYAEMKDSIKNKAKI